MDGSNIFDVESARLAALADLQILDTASEKIFDSITQLATESCGIPISLIVFIDKDRQWFKSTYGVPEKLKDIRETPRDIAFCKETILQDDLLEIQDLTTDTRFNTNPFVTEFPNIRFYAGVPLSTANGMNVGTICLLDQQPRKLTEEQKTVLKYLSKIIITLVEAKRNLSQITLLGEALETSYNQIYLFDTKTLLCIYANQSAANLLQGENKNKLFCITDKFSSYSKDEFLQIIATLLSKEQETVVIESTTTRPDGTEYPAELRMHLSYAKSEPILIVVANDITDRKNHEKHLQEYRLTLEACVQERTASLAQSLGLIKATLESTTDAILVTNINGDIIDANKRFYDLFSHFNIDKDVQFDKFIRIQLASPEVFDLRLLEIKNHPQQNTHDELILRSGRIFESNSQPQVVDEHIIGRVWSFRDVTAEKNLQQQLMQQASHDSLTGIPNRLLLEDRINQSIQYAIKSNSLVAVCLIDLDRFKSVNDMHGHNTGDELLRQVAARLKNNLRANDTVARLGGDEFIVLLNHFQKVDEVTSYLQHFANIISAEYRIENKLIAITASMGISIFPKDGNDVSLLLRQADIAMYRSKGMLGNCFNYFTTEMNTDATKLMEIEKYLSNALENREMSLNYQPVLDLHTGNIVAVEALIRWSHPKLGLVSPTDFISVAESTGQILSIGEWVFRTACMQLQSWSRLGISNLHVAINVSAQQFKQTNFIETIKRIILETNANPNLIDIEITESIMLENIGAVSSKMQDLKNMGMTLVIDDFGTGYSSLSYLNNLPVSKLKIDRSFIANITSPNSDTAIISAIITMASSLGLKVLSEGVDQPFQKTLLKDKGCHEIQGFLFSKPLDHEDFFKLYSCHKRETTL